MKRTTARRAKANLKSVVVTTRVSRETKARLSALAKDTRRSESFVAAEAIESYIDLNAWQVGLVKRRLAEVEAGAPTVPHEDVERWLDSLGTGRALPMPKPKA
jgi:predicted transcriptional regulator